MLIIRKINPTGMFSYGWVPDIDVEQRGRVHLLGINNDTGGDSNASGKSSLFNSICEILFGENPTEVSGDKVINNKMDSGFAGRVEFVSWEGVYYRVTYCRKWKEDYYPVDNDTQTAYKASTANLFFEKYDGNCWKDLRGSNMGETRKFVLTALGITYSRFVSIAYLSPRVGSTILRGKNADRVDIFAGITGVEEWDKVLANSRSRKISIQQEVASVQQQISYTEGQCQQLQQRLDQMRLTNWEELLAKYDHDLQYQNEQITVIETRINEKLTAIAEATNAQQVAYQQTGVGALSQEISDLTIKVNELCNPHFIDESLSQFDQTHSQNVEDKRAELNLKRGELNAFLSKGDFREIDVCPTCGVPIDAGRKEHIQKEVDIIEEAIIQLEGEVCSLSKVRDDEEERVRSSREITYNERRAYAEELKKEMQKLSWKKNFLKKQES